MQPILSEYYGDNTRWFVATVVDASPPYGREGRVKIRVHGLHTENTLDIPQNDLPWAQCVVPTTEGGISGIGRIPKLQAGALVFGMFIDGMNSQVPIVFGSLPHVETPTSVQLARNPIFLGSDLQAQDVFQTNVEIVAKGDTADDTTSAVNLIIKRNREKTAVNFFLNVGYSVKQAIGLTAGLSRISNMTVGNPGIGGFSKQRYTELKNFSENFNSFSTQLKFVLFELNNSRANANIRLLQSDKIEGKNGIAEIVAKYYLDGNTTREFVEEKADELLDRIS